MVQIFDFDGAVADNQLGRVWSLRNCDGLADGRQRLPQGPDSQKNPPNGIKNPVRHGGYAERERDRGRHNADRGRLDRPEPDAVADEADHDHGLQHNKRGAQAHADLAGLEERLPGGFQTNALLQRDLILWREELQRVEVGKLSTTDPIRADFAD